MIAASFLGIFPDSAALCRVPADAGKGQTAVGNGQSARPRRGETRPLNPMQMTSPTDEHVTYQAEKQAAGRVLTPFDEGRMSRVKMETFHVR
jgi:hypothetical protein